MIFSKKQEDNNSIDADNSSSSNINKPIYCICRRGIASVQAVNTLLEKMNKDYDEDDSNNNQHKNQQRFIYNIDGGLSAWTNEIDPSFPKY